MAGWVRVYRSILFEDQWTKEPFTKGQAWIDMILLAHWKPGSITVQGVVIPVERGDLSWSEGRLAKRWQWSVGKVRRFFDELEQYGRCDRKRYRQRDRRKSILIICDYEKYNGENSQDSIGDGMGNGIGDGIGNKKKRNGELSYCKNSAPEGAPKQSFSQEDFARFWEAFAYKKGKVDATKAWKSIKDMNPELVEQIVAGAKVCAGQRPALIARGQTPKMAQGWLSGRRWEDEIESITPKTCETCRHYGDQCQGKKEICSAYEVAA